MFAYRGLCIFNTARRHSRSDIAVIFKDRICFAGFLKAEQAKAIYFLFAIEHNLDVGYFLAMVEEMGTRAEIAEGTFANLKAALDAGLGDGNVPEIFDLFLNHQR